MRVGGPLRLLVVVDPASLRLRMTELTRRIEGVELVGAFSSATEAIDHILWERPIWHLAYVDMGLPEDGSKDVVNRLLAMPSRGNIIGLVDHLWSEVREKCAALGVTDIIEKADIVAYQDNLERRLR
jgi:DNA-binding NarL/FixJ family response regulator